MVIYMMIVFYQHQKKIFCFWTYSFTNTRKNHVYLLNPGSISLPKEDNPPSYAVYENGIIKIKTFTNNIRRN